jgi:hypothetical protein
MLIGRLDKESNMKLVNKTLANPSLALRTTNKDGCVMQQSLIDYHVLVITTLVDYIWHMEEITIV